MLRQVCLTGEDIPSTALNIKLFFFGGGGSIDKRYPLRLYLCDNPSPA